MRRWRSRASRRCCRRERGPRVVGQHAFMCGCGFSCSWLKSCLRSRLVVVLRCAGVVVRYRLFCSSCQLSFLLLARHNSGILPHDEHDAALGTRVSAVRPEEPPCTILSFLLCYCTAKLSFLTWPAARGGNIVGSISSSSLQEPRGEAVDYSQEGAILHTLAGPSAVSTSASHVP